MESNQIKPMYINSAWFEMLDEFVQSKGIPREAIFPEQDTYLKWRRSSQVEYSELKLCLKRVVNYSNDYIAIYEAVESLNPMSFGTVGVMLSTAPDLRTLLKLMSEFQALFTGSHRTVYRETPYGEGELWLIDRSTTNEDQLVQKELIILYGAALLKLIRVCCGEPTLKVHFKMLAWYIGDDNLERFKKIIGCEMDYGHSMRRISIKREDLDKPLKYANSSLHQTVKKLAYEELRLSNQTSIIALTHKAIHKLGFANVNQEVVAQFLNMSSRTYSRRLKELDTSFVEVLKQTRLEVVLREFDAQKDNLTEIAFELGFSDLSAFSHAFKRWTGMSPKEALSKLASIER